MPIDNPETSTHNLRSMRQLCLGSLMLWTSIFSPLAFAGTGVIKADEKSECPTSIAAAVYERSTATSKVLGAIPDGNTVRVDMNTEAGPFYRVQGNGYSGALSGYVYKGCVEITSAADPSLPVISITPSVANKSASTVKPAANRADCTHILSAGCSSFNEMLNHGDREILKAISGHTDALVCFKEAEDVFIVIDFNNPFKRSDVIRKAFGIVDFARYKNGQRETFEFWAGSWTRAKDEDSEDAKFVATNLTAYMNSTEIFLSYRYPNVSGTVTRYSLSIRQSTLRFLETYDAKIKKGPYHEEGEGTCYRPD